MNRGAATAGSAPPAELVALDESLQAAFNAHDTEAMRRLLHPEVALYTYARRSGPDEFMEYIETTRAQHPGIKTEVLGRVAWTHDTLVSEYRHPPQPGATWRLDGTMLTICRARDGRIDLLRVYYKPSPTDSFNRAPVLLPGAGRKIGMEQAALRRVATLVAANASQETVFAAVNEEIAELVGAETTSLMRFEPDDDAISLVAVWPSECGDHVGAEPQPLDEALRALRDSGRASQFGPAELPSSGPFVDEARRAGVRSAVGVPITVEGRSWGVSYAARVDDDPFPDDTAERMAGFTELIAMAIANAQSAEAVRRLAVEQSALRRVAELAASGVDQHDVLDAVVTEASQLLGDLPADLVRCRPGGPDVVVASCGSSPNPPDAAADVIAVPINVGGRLWGHLRAVPPAGRSSPGAAERLGQFARVVATAIAGAESRAELLASRARVMATADATRHQIQRDVHDGAQQRLVQTVMALRLALQAFGESDDPAVALVEESLSHAQRAMRELRDFVRGILPPSLVRGGLQAGIDSIVADLPLPVDVRVTVGRLPAPLETTAYFVVAESLTNVVKHAGSGRAEVLVDLGPGALDVTVRDFGPGGADPLAGSGLTGLLDRVEAVDGTLTILSEPGEGTTVRAWLPLKSGTIAVQ